MGKGVPPPAQVVFPAFEVTKVSLFIVFPPHAQVVFPALEVTQVLLFIVPPPSQVVFSTLEVTKCRYLSCSRPCPSGVSRSLPKYRYSLCFPLAQVVSAALEVTKSLLFIVFPPPATGGVSRPPSY